MRPSALDPLFAPADALPGIGPKNAKLFNRLLGKPEGARVLDVLFHLPQAVVDRRARPKIRDAIPGTIVTIEAKVTEHHGPPNSRSRAPFKVLVEDDTGDVELVFFLMRGRDHRPLHDRAADTIVVADDEGGRPPSQ